MWDEEAEKPVEETAEEADEATGELAGSSPAPEALASAAHNLYEKCEDLLSVLENDPRHEILDRAYRSVRDAVSEYKVFLI